MLRCSLYLQCVIAGSPLYLSLQDGCWKAVKQVLGNMSGALAGTAITFCLLEVMLLFLCDHSFLANPVGE